MNCSYMYQHESHNHNVQRKMQVDNNTSLIWWFNLYNTQKYVKQLHNKMLYIKGIKMHENDNHQLQDNSWLWEGKMGM